MKQKKQENTSKEYSLVSNIAYVLKGSWKMKKSLLFFMAVRIISSGAESYVPLLVTKFVIDGIESGKEIKEFLMVVAAAVLFQMSMSLTKSLVNYQLWHRMGYVNTQYQLLRVQKIHTIDYELLESQKMQDLVKRAEDGADGMDSLLYNITTFGFHLFKVLIACAIIFTASPWMILLVVVFSIGRYLVSDHTKKWVKEHVDNENIPARRQEKYYGSVTRDFKYGKDIRLFHMADGLYSRLEEVQTEIYKRSNRGRRIKMLADNTNVALELFIQTGIMYGWMVYDVLFNGMTIGNFTLYLGSIRRFGGAVSNVFSDFVSFRDINRRLNDLRTFLEYPSTVPDETVEIPEAKTYTFVFEHVWFRYPGHEEYVLKDVSITIEGGKRLAVVGPNGAGKSTFIKLLCRLYKPTKGRITVNGIDIWKVDQQRYFHLLAPVFQNVESYAASLAQNISLQTKDKTDKKAAEACIRKAGLSDKLDSLDKGIDTQLLRFLYEDGIDLSGGEKQKLSFARALYKVADKEGTSEDNNYPKARVFVLDEPTAALDALAEYRMYSGFNELIKENTAVYISHRLSSTRFCHKVALFEEGQIIEYGTHDELLKDGKRYAELYQVQARYYQEDKGGAEDEQ